MRLSVYNPFNAIFTKELRCSARRKRTYALRSVYVLLLLLAMLVMWLEARRWGGGGIVERQLEQQMMGRAFFGLFAVFSCLAMAAITPILTSASISGERMGKTLTVLFMTPISSWQIVSGKLLSRMWIALTLLGLSLPVLALVRLLGGVEIEEMAAVLCLSLATALLGAAAGLWFSSFINRTWAVILLSYALLGLWWIFLPFLLGISVGRGSDERAVVAMLGWINPMVCIGLMVGQAPWPAPWIECCAVHVGVSAALLWWSARAVRRSDTAMSISAPTLRGSAAPPRRGASDGGAGESVPADESLRLKLLGDNPVFWRERCAAVLGKRWGVMLMLVALVLIGVTYLLVLDRRAHFDPDAHAGYAIVFHSLLLLAACVLSATAVATEKESDTWTLLNLTPLTGRQIVYGKLWGILRRLSVPAAITVGHFVLFVGFGNLPWRAGVVAVWIMLCGLAPFIVVGLWLGFKVKRTTTAVILSLLTPVAVYAVLPVMVSAAARAARVSPGLQFTEASTGILAGTGLGRHNAQLLVRICGSHDYGRTTNRFEQAWAYYQLGPVVDALAEQRAWESARNRRQLPLSLWVGLFHLAVALAGVEWMVLRYDRLTGRAAEAH